MGAKISVIINTINEEKNLLRALNSIKGFADEIVVVDMKSDDKTVEIAKSFGARVFEHERTNYVEPARNFAIGQATGDWILILDADESVSHTLLRKLKKLSREDQADYYRLPRKNIIFGKWMKHSRWWPDYNIRFFKRGFVAWSDTIHSVPLTQGRGADLRALEKNALLHYHYESIEQYIDRLNRYTTIQAKNRAGEGYIFRWQDIVLRPSSEFLSRFFAGRGYKDGLHGLALSYLQGFSELVVCLKVWQAKGFEEKQLKLDEVAENLTKAQKELNYWKAHAAIDEKQGNLFLLRIKRKFKLA